MRFLGFREDIPELMAAADVLVHPSRLDVTGQVILEAIVNGLPAVVTGALRICRARREVGRRHRAAGAVLAGGPRCRGRAHARSGAGRRPCRSPASVMGARPRRCPALTRRPTSSTAALAPVAPRGARAGQPARRRTTSRSRSSSPPTTGPMRSMPCCAGSRGSRTRISRSIVADDGSTAGHRRAC